MNVVMIGAGYVGLVSGSCFADMGARVTCVDVDTDKIENLNNGRIPIYEPGLDELVERNARAGRLFFTTDFAEAIPAADLVFIAVGTPPGADDGRADLSCVYQAAKDIAPHLEGYTVVIDKSTVPVGTARKIKQIIAKANPQARFDVASNPEFLREGVAINDFMHPDRVVLGTESAESADLLNTLYDPLKNQGTPILQTAIETAELIKYASNAFLATKVTFINEMSALCEAVGADIRDVSSGMGLDSRIGPKFLQAGPGYGGSCFPKDTIALVNIAKDNGIACNVTEAVIFSNNEQKLRMVHKIEQALGGRIDGKTIAILGLTFKPETDDMRESPALAILPKLLEAGANLKACDPQGIPEAKKILPQSIQYCDDVESAVASADAIVLMTEWKHFHNLDLASLKNLMKGDVFIDLRNIYERDQMQNAGFKYHCVGR